MSGSSEDKGYKVVSISLYNQDIEDLDNLKAEAQRRGLGWANKSAIIRFALSQIDIEDLVEANNDRRRTRID